MLLEGLRILLVEDETMVSFLVEDMLLDLGCALVWHAGSVADALDLLDGEEPDLAVLDVNLGREFVYPVAERLASIGIPFIFATGYGRNGIAEPWRPRPVIQKPFLRATLAAALGQAIAAASPIGDA